jgi:hypothetical protein
MFWLLILVDILLLSLGIYAYRSLPPEIALFYHLPWGENRLAHPISLIIPFVLIQFSYLSISLCIRRYYRHDPFIHKFGSLCQGICIGLGSYIITRSIIAHW